MTKVSVLSIALVVVFLLAVAFPVFAQEEPGDEDCISVIVNINDGSETLVRASTMAAKPLRRSMLPSTNQSKAGLKR